MQDCQCARCGSSMILTECTKCHGEGTTEPGELYEEDPLWYDEYECGPCPECNGVGGWYDCMSSEEWCQANPIPGRELTTRSVVEWFDDGEKEE